MANETRLDTMTAPSAREQLRATRDELRRLREESRTIGGSLRTAMQLLGYEGEPEECPNEEIQAVVRTLAETDVRVQVLAAEEEALQQRAADEERDARAAELRQRRERRLAREGVAAEEREQLTVAADSRLELLQRTAERVERSFDEPLEAYNALYETAFRTDDGKMRELVEHARSSEIARGSILRVLEGAFRTRVEELADAAARISWRPANSQGKPRDDFAAEVAELRGLLSDDSSTPESAADRLKSYDAIRQRIRSRIFEARIEDRVKEQRRRTEKSAERLRDAPERTTARALTGLDAGLFGDERLRREYERRSSRSPVEYLNMLEQRKASALKLVALSRESDPAVATAHLLRFVATGDARDLMRASRMDAGADQLDAINGRREDGEALTADEEGMLDVLRVLSDATRNLTRSGYNAQIGKMTLTGEQADSLQAILRNAELLLPALRVLSLAFQKHQQSRGYTEDRDGAFLSWLVQDRRGWLSGYIAAPAGASAEYPDAERFEALMEEWQQARYKKNEVRYEAKLLRPEEHANAVRDAEQAQRYAKLLTELLNDVQAYVRLRERQPEVDADAERLRAVKEERSAAIREKWAAYRTRVHEFRTANDTLEKRRRELHEQADGLQSIYNRYAQHERLGKSYGTDWVDAKVTENRRGSWTNANTVRAEELRFATALRDSLIALKAKMDADTPWRSVLEKIHAELPARILEAGQLVAGFEELPPTPVAPQDPGASADGKRYVLEDDELSAVAAMRSELVTEQEQELRRLANRLRGKMDEIRALEIQPRANQADWQKRRYALPETRYARIAGRAAYGNDVDVAGAAEELAQEGAALRRQAEEADAALAKLKEPWAQATAASGSAR